MSRTKRKEKTKCKPADEVEKKQNRAFKRKKRQGVAGNLIEGDRSMRITKYLSLMDIIVYGGIILIVFLGLFCNGCTVIWTDHAFIYTFAKTVDANDLGFVADADSTRIGSGETTTENDKIKAITPYGVVETNQ